MKKFNKFFERNSALPCNILLVGSKGIGKSFSIYHGIEKWNPEFSERIKATKTPDLLEIQGNEGISEIRDSLQAFVSQTAKELQTKVLVLKNIDFYSLEVCDLLLKTIEENNTFSLFATSLSENIRPALASRLHIYHIPDLSKEEIRQICEGSSRQVHLLKIIDKWSFKSIFELESYSKYSFEDLFTSLYVKALSPAEILEALEPFFKSIKELPVFDKLPLIYFFLEYFSARVLQEPITDVKSQRYQKNLTKVLLRYSSSLLANLNNPTYYSQINLEHQITGFFLTIFTLKFI